MGKRYKWINQKDSKKSTKRKFYDIDKTGKLLVSNRPFKRFVRHPRCKIIKGKALLLMPEISQDENGNMIYKSL